VSTCYWLSLHSGSLGKEGPRPVPLVSRVMNRRHRLLSLSYFILPSGTVWLSAKSLPSACVLALGKILFAEKVYAGWLSPRVTLGKGFAGGFRPFAECPWHSA